jgi:hypothetical protein
MREESQSETPNKRIPSGDLVEKWREVLKPAKKEIIFECED